MAEQRRETILQVRLEGDLSLGQLGGLFRDLQTAVRASATVLDKPPPYRSVRLAGLQPGSLDIGVQVVGWAHDLTLDAGVAIVEIARGVIQPLAVAVIVNIFLRRFEQRRLRRQEQVETERHEDIAKRLERLERLANQTHVVVSRRPERIEGLGPSDRRRLIEDVARQFNADPVRVEAAVSATEAMERSVGVIRASGGGLIVAEQAEETVEVKAR